MRPSVMDTIFFLQRKHKDAKENSSREKLHPNLEGLEEPAQPSLFGELEGGLSSALENGRSW